jgi:uncharacterized protein
VNLAAVLVTGLFAGGVSCAAVQGGLLTGLIARHQAASGRPAARSGGNPIVRAGRSGNPAVRASLRDRADRTSATQVLQRPAWRAQIGDDLAPVGGFLAGKLVSHAVLGALLGALGSVVQLSTQARTLMQLAAGVVIIVFALAQLGVPGFRNVVIEPPHTWLKIVRNRARSQAALAPALLGVATVLIPCGVTLSVEALALTSGSWLAGAATMAVFVLGTGPLFALLGYAARKAATAWRGRLAAITGVVVLATGLYTLNGGFELAGSPLSASRLAQAVFGEPPADISTVSTVDGKQVATITARTNSYSPKNVEVHAGLPTTLVVHSEGASGCIRSFVISSHSIQKVLPANGDTRIELGTLQPGKLRYACGMGMYTGFLTIV